MKRSVLEFFFSKCFFVGVAALTLHLSASAQLNPTGLHANFGIDGDTRASFSKFGSAPQPNTGDDWFSSSLSGKNVLDTSNASHFRSELKARKNICFQQTMSERVYSKVNGRLWVDAAYSRDYTSASGVDSTVFSGGSKNGMNPLIWSGAIGNVPGKTDIVDGYVHLRREGPVATDSLWLMAGLSTLSTSGDRHFDVELYKNGILYDRTTKRFITTALNEGRTEWKFDASGNIIQTGDLIVSVSYKSGRPPELDVRIWVSRLTFNSRKPRLFKFGNDFDGGVLYGYASVLTQNNTTNFGSGIGNFSGSERADTTYSTPWGTLNSAGAWSANYDQLQFVEFGLNLTRMGIDPSLYSGNGTCVQMFQSLFFKSRSSNSFTASLQDFVGPIQFRAIAPLYTVNSNIQAITCEKPVVTLSVPSSAPQGDYSWTTTNGNIIHTNEDSSSIQLNKKGSYVLSTRLAIGCPAFQMETFNVLADSIPPIASADMAITDLGKVQLLGGDSLASSIMTPMGGSMGLSWKWTGPGGFTSTEQSPIINLEWPWGSYYLEVTELRNGCVGKASLDIGFFDIRHLQSAENMSLGITEKTYVHSGTTKVSVVSVVNEASNGLVIVYSTSGQELFRKAVSLNRGVNTIEVPLMRQHQVRLVNLYTGGKLAFRGKVIH